MTESGCGIYLVFLWKCALGGAGNTGFLMWINRYFSPKDENASCDYRAQESTTMLISADSGHQIMCSIDKVIAC
jgi:hypothetical protein